MFSMGIWDKSSGIIPAKQSEDKVDELVIQFDATEVTYKRNEWNKNHIILLLLDP